MASIDWTTALGGAAVGWFASGKVEDFKSETKKAVTETAAAAATAAAQAVLNGQFDQFEFDQSGQAAGQAKNGKRG